MTRPPPYLFLVYFRRRARCFAAVLSGDGVGADGARSRRGIVYGPERMAKATGRGGTLVGPGSPRTIVVVQSLGWRRFHTDPRGGAMPHWIENLLYSVEEFDRESGSLIEVLARVRDLDAARS